MVKESKRPRYHNWVGINLTISGSLALVCGFAILFVILYVVSSIQSNFPSDSVDPIVDSFRNTAFIALIIGFIMISIGIAILIKIRKDKTKPDY